MEKEQNLILEKIFLSLLFMYFLILWISEYFFRREYGDSLDIFFLFSHLVFLVGAVFLLKKDFHGIFIPEKKTTLTIISLVIVYCLILFLKFPEKVIWLDEHIQFIFGSHIVRSNVIERAFNQQQPPLDYLLMGHAQKYFGNSVFAVKFHAMFFGGATLLFLPSLMKSFFGSFSSRFNVSFVFVFSPFFISYALEGRPIALTLFAATSFLLFLFDYLKNSGSLAWLLLSSLFLLSATSLQPHILIFSAFLISTAFYWKKVRFRLVYLGALVALWRFAIDYRIYQTSTHQRVFVEEGEGIFGLLANFIQRVSFYLSQNNEWQLLVIGLSLGFCLLLALRRERQSLYLLSLFIAFFGTYSIVWDFSVNSVLNPRYMICGLPIVFLFVGNLLFRLENFKEYKSYYLTLPILVLGFFFISRPLALHSKASVRPAWDRTYQFLNEIVDEDDIILHVAFAGISDFMGQGHIGSLFYGNDVVNKRVLNYEKNRDWYAPNYIYFDSKRDYTKPNDMVVLLLNRNEQEPRFIRFNYKGLREFYHFQGIDVLIFKREGNLYQSLKAVFEEILKTHGVVEKTRPFLEALIYMENRYGNIKGLRGYIDLYKSMTFKSKYNHRGFVIDKKGEHQKRIKTFEDFYSTWSKR